MSKEHVPAWMKKQRLTLDLIDLLRSRMSCSCGATKNDGVIKAIAKEVIQLGYRKLVKPSKVPMKKSNNSEVAKRAALIEELHTAMLPRISYWMQKNRADVVRDAINEVIYLGYRVAVEAA
tara:strand:- start:2783 stop:3145 length:363 start_codon:yes stop_codon:yes gene_type:complete